MQLSKIWFMLFNLFLKDGSEDSSDGSESLSTLSTLSVSILRRHALNIFFFIKSYISISRCVSKFSLNGFVAFLTISVIIIKKQ